MEGFLAIQKLPTEVREQIIQKYESLEKFYQIIFDLNAQEYSLFMKKPHGYQENINEIQRKIYEIEDQLESFGISDGSYITSKISADHGDIIVESHIENLDNRLKELGTDYITMSKWLKENYGI